MWIEFPLVCPAPGSSAMMAEFFDRQEKSNPLNGARIGDRQQLLKVFNGLMHRKPFFCELVGENGYSLLLGIGQHFTCAQYSPSDGSTPYLMAVGTSKPDNNQYVEFLTADVPSPVPMRFCVAPGTVKEIAVHFIETGNRYPGVSWEEI